MSIYDKASLVQIPSGVKSGTLYNVVPNTADGDFDASRGSTATRVNKDGLIETVAANTPRLDYPLLDGVVQDCPALLLEPSRTNLISQSENINSWNNQYSPTLTQNSSISPDGSVNADKITATNSSSAKYISVTTVNSTQYNVSVFVKNINSQRSRIEIYNSPNCILEFNWTNNQPSTQSVTTFTDVSYTYYGNDWWRISANFTATGTNNFYVYPDRINSTDSILLWGAQVEAGSYSTSYIKTTSSQATRSADVCNGAGTSDTFNDSEGVLFGEISTISDSTFKRISIDSGSYTNSVVFDFDNTNNLYGKVFVGGSAVSTTLASGLDIDNNNKLALKYKSGDYALWVNGFEFDGGTNTNTPTGLNSLNFELGGFNHFYGNTKQLMTFNEALSDSELEDLTSWDSFNEMAKGQLYTIE